MNLDQLVDDVVSRQKNAFTKELLQETEAHQYFEQGRVLLTLDAPRFILLHKNCLCVIGRKFDHWQAKYFILSKAALQSIDYAPTCFHVATHPFGQLNILSDLAKISQKPAFKRSVEFDMDSIERYVITSDIL